MHYGSLVIIPSLTRKKHVWQMFQKGYFCTNVMKCTRYFYANNEATNGDIAWNKLLWQSTNIVHLSVHDFTHPSNKHVLSILPRLCKYEMHFNARHG